MRIFLAIELPENVKDKLVEVQERLRPRLPGVRWEKREKLHVTLVFLGEVGEEGKNEVETRLITSVQEGVKSLKSVKKIELHLGNLGVFPNLRRPRVIWVGIEENLKVGRLVELVRSLKEGLRRAGFEFDKKPFYSHVTIGRIRRSVGSLPLEALCEAKSEVGFEVDSVSVIKSELRPTGSVYTRLARIPLEASPAVEVPRRQFLRVKLFTP